MPLVKLQKTGKQSGWAIWFVAERKEELIELSSEPCPNEIISSQKQLEWLAGRVLIKTLVEHSGLSYTGLHKDKFGKPFLNEHPHLISLSHSFPYVAAQIDPTAPVGIDLEQPKDKLLKIAHRIMAAEELADAGQDVTKHCVYWCAKEAMYKIHGKRGLIFSNHLTVVPFQLLKEGNLKGKIEDNGKSQQVDLHYMVQPEYILVYTKAGNS